MIKMDYGNYHPKGHKDKITSATVSKHQLKKTPQNNQSLREKSAKPNQLPQILKDYKQFCEKYFNNASSLNNGLTAPIQYPSFSMSHPISPLPESETMTIPHGQIPNPANVQLSCLDDCNFFFCYTAFNQNEYLFGKVNIKYHKQSLGLEKNNKTDYEQRIQKLRKQQNKDSIDEDKYDEEFCYKDELEVNNKNLNNPKPNKENSNENENENVNDKHIINSNDNLKESDKENNINNKSNTIFDDETNKKINDEVNEQKVTKIQIAFRRYCANRKDRIYVGYDKSNNYIISIYINKRTDLVEFFVNSLDFKIYSLETQELKYVNKDIKDLLNTNSISKSQIKNVIPDLIEKVLVLDKEDSGYGFETHSKGNIVNDIDESVSSIGQVEYDNM